MTFWKIGYSVCRVPFGAFLNCFDETKFLYIIVVNYFLFFFMFKFIANAFREIGHVVWPTPKETRTYMNYTVVTIIVLTIFLSVI